MTGPRSLEEELEYYKWLVGPRKVGGRYWSGYWKQAYTVDEILLTGPLDEATRIVMTVTWDDGTTTTHCTKWDERKDKVL